MAISPLSPGFVRGLENLECALILFSVFKCLLEFPKLAFKSLEFVDVDLSSSCY